MAFSNPKSCGALSTIKRLIGNESPSSGSRRA
jgi:hypothetical protein